MALPATDNFTNTNGVQLDSHNANWGVYNAFDIQSNAASPDRANDESGAAYTGESFSNDQYSEAIIAGLVNSESVGVAVRGDGSGTFYGYYSDVDTGTKYIFKIVGGSWTELNSATSDIVVTDTVRIEAEGTTITPILNGSEDTDLSAQTDSAIASGAAGLCGFDNSTSMQIDDWEGGNLGVVANAMPMAMHHYRMMRN